MSLFVCLCFFFCVCLFMYSNESRRKKCTKRDNDDYGVFLVCERVGLSYVMLFVVFCTHKTFFCSKLSYWVAHFNNAIIIVSLCLMWFCVCSIECFVFRWKIVCLHVGVIFEKRKERYLYIIIKKKKENEETSYEKWITKCYEKFSACKRRKSSSSNNAENYVVLTETFVCHVCISC